MVFPFSFKEYNLYYINSSNTILNSSLNSFGKRRKCVKRLEVHSKMDVFGSIVLNVCSYHYKKSSWLVVSYLPNSFKCLKAVILGKRPGKGNFPRRRISCIFHLDSGVFKEFFTISAKNILKIRIAFLRNFNGLFQIFVWIYWPSTNWTQIWLPHGT